MEGFGFMSEDERAMMLFQLFQEAVLSGGPSSSARQEESDKLKCPVCSKEHDDVVNDDAEFSHGCLKVFIKHQCPICLDETGPPMVAFPCGHLVCEADFTQLGGFTGDDNTAQARAERKRERQRRARERERERPDPAQFMRQLQMMGMIGMSPFGPFAGGGFYEDEEDDDDEYNSDEDSDSSMPPLEQMDGQPGQDDDDDDSLPPLVRRAGTGRNARNNASDDDSMPPLERLDGGNQDETFSDDGSLPPLVRRRVGNAAGSNNSDDDSMPPLEQVDCTQGDASNIDDSDSMPPLEEL